MDLVHMCDVDRYISKVSLSTTHNLAHSLKVSVVHVTISHEDIIDYICMFNPLPDDKILDWSKLKQIADNIWKCIKIWK